MNMLVFMTDQLSFRSLRAYGGSKSFPAIDGFFENGATLEQVYSPCPLCLPARASFWTSRLPHRTGVLSNGRLFENAEVTADTPSLGSLFSAAGWECVHFGKEHDGGALHGFRRMEPGLTRVRPQPGYPVNQDTFGDRFTAEQACTYFDERARSGHQSEPRPLLAVVDLVNPHNICGWVGEMARHVLGEEAAVVPSPSEEPTPGFPPTIETAMLPELPPNHYDADFTSRPRSVQYQCCAHNRLAQTQGWGEREFRLYLDAYNHYIHLVDREIARIMERATACLDMSQTFVVFTSDHGDAITAHSGATKHTTFYEETTRVPFAVTGPGIAPGARVGGVASLLDLVPTLLDLADITAGADAEAERARSALSLMDGQSQAGPLTSGRRLARAAGEGSRYVVSEWHTEWGFTIEPGRMITDGRYKLMRYAEGDEEEFYDLAADPYETRNLLGKEASDSPSGLTAPGNAESLGRLREELKRHLRNSGDPFEDLEPSIDPRWRSHEPGYHKHRGIAAPQADRP